VIGTVIVAYNILPDVVAQKYQFIEIMRKDAGDPNKVDWSKGYYELMESPSNERLRPEFAIMEYQYVASWDEAVEKGKLIAADFPDKVCGGILVQESQVLESQSRL
jgi:hypothetical protein